METIIVEPLPPLLPSLNAGKEACDVTGRDPKSLFISNTVFFLEHIDSIYPKTISFKQIFRHDHNETICKGFLLETLPVTSKPGLGR